MTRITRLLPALLIGALAVPNAAAQWNVARFDRAANRLYTVFGFDPALVSTVGYARVVPILGHHFQFAGDVGIGTAGFDPQDYRARLEVRSSVLRWRSLHLTGSAAFITRGTENSIYRGLNFGSDFTGTAGVYRPRWFVAGDVGFDKAIITHITHSDWYRKYFYPDAKDGWYLNAGGTFHYGFTAGVSLGPLELTGRGGWHRTQEAKDLPAPFWGSLGLGVAF